jgi:hypothetical protein
LFDGFQVNTPVPGLIVAPAGAPAPSEKVNVFCGRSASDALAVKVRVALYRIAVVAAANAPIANA